ncbi:MAG TPA: alpha/beta hydrolase-fold protein [Gemmataceae bacterium]|nr:alpha/beta hydrolase-fold protein [Gemmataceae bacterium]
MQRRWFLLVVAFVVLGLAIDRFQAAEPATTALRFEITVARDLVDLPPDGRLLVILGRSDRPEPRLRIGTFPGAATVLGGDVHGLLPGAKVSLDQSAMIFPVAHLAKLPPGVYYAQALLDVSRDLKLENAPGNFYGDSVQVNVNPAVGGTIPLHLTRKLPPEELPADTEYVKFIKLRSELLSRFHGRPIHLRAAVILPRDFEKNNDQRYPLRVHIGGFATRFTAAQSFLRPNSEFRKAWLADGAPRMLLLHLDGAGPFGDPYQVNSANNGPYGDAVTQELIPYVEQRYRGIGQPYARVLDGGSTGGWVSLALQVFYPDFFNGAWSHAPDPVDFRAFELINIYDDTNVYINRRGFERPSAREINGDVRFTMRHEVQIERVLGRGDRWELGGRDWGSWNAVFGPRGPDGLPKPLWDGQTGQIDRSVLEHWKPYDLRLTLQRNWKTLGPKLRGKLRVWVGEADDYFLNNAVHLLDDFLARAEPAFGGSIRYGPRGDHGWRVLSQRQLLEEMAAAIEQAKPSR